MPNKTFKQYYEQLKTRLAESGIESADLEARLILEKRAGVRWADLITKPDEILPPEALAMMEKDKKARIEGIPLSRIYGEREFWGLSFSLSPETLDPRPDTEILVERALDAFGNNAPETILDLGTGTGCILIALLGEWKDAQGIGVDLSLGALQIARRNAVQNQVESRLRFICGSWLESIDGKFDLIVSNPPYIANQIIPALSKEVKNHDPILALNGGEDGLQAYSDIFSSLKSHLNEGGKALFEIGFDQRFDVVRLAEDSGLHVCGVYADLAGLPRVVEICCGDK